MSNSEEQKAIGEILRGIDRPVIVELGAHVGEECGWLSDFKPAVHVMVEPEPLNVDRIRREHPRLDLMLFQGAIASYNGRIGFYRSENNLAMNRASGSIHTPTGHLKYFPEVSFDSILNVQCWTLDFLCAHIDRIDLLWVDIQGAERDMIAGGQQALAKTRYMMIEAEPEVELYEGQALKPELIALLPGWEVLRDFGYNLLMRNTTL